MLPLLVAAPSCAQQVRLIGADVAAEPKAGPAWASYDEMLDELLPGMGAENTIDRETPQKEFEDLCFYAARPGAEDERRALCTAIIGRLGPETAKPARVWMLRQLAQIGGNESVGRLAELLNDRDHRIRELSRRALQNIPSVAAAGALCWALEYAEESDWRVALINAIATHPGAVTYVELMGRDGGRSTYDTLSELAGDEEPAVGSPAIAALADLGGTRAIEALYALWHGNDDARRDAAASGLTRVAEQLVARGEGRRAEQIFLDIYSSGGPQSLCIAALRGLVAVRGEGALPLLLEVVTGDDPHMAATAASFAEQIPGTAATRMLGEAFHDASPDTQVLLLNTLGARGDVAARPTAVDATKSDNQQVRVAALRGLQTLGDSSTVMLLAEAGAGSPGEERQAARASLSRLRGEDVDEIILAGLEEQTDASVRCELITAAAARWYRPAIPTLLTASKDQDESVQVAAFDALGSLAWETDLPELVRRLIDTLGDEPRQAAENAVVETSMRIDDAEQRAEPVLTVLDDADGLVKASLIRVLGRIGGGGALQAIRAARQDTDADVVDAVVRALASWPDLEVTDDLLDIAGTSSSETQRVLALRGYVRLARLPSEREPLETFQMLKEAMHLAERVEEKKLVLSGLADVRHVEALKMAESHLGDEELREEAAVTMLTIARALVAQQRGAALNAIEKVRAADTSEAVQQQLREVTEFIERFAGYGAAWVISGPYMEEEKESADLFEMVFPPETPEAEDVEWTRLAVNNRDNPWIFDLAKAIGGVSRCVYVRTLVWSYQERPATLEIGSDDAVKAWLNGELVHSNLVRRGITPGEDKAAVTLSRGWNTLMLKIVQGGGEWAFCAGLKTPDGATLEGLKFAGE